MIVFFDEDESGESTRTQDMLYPRCDNCQQDLTGSRHVYWNLGSQRYEYNCKRKEA